MKKALIIVDLQNYFCHGGALPVPEGDKITPRINKLQNKFDLVVATQDWHPKNHGSFAVNHPQKNIGESIVLNGLQQILWPVHCVQGTPGAEFIKELKVNKISKIIQKGTDEGIDSYSGFFDNGHKKATNLEGYLKKQGITEVYVVGLATDYCVKFTAMDAITLEFKTYLVADACRGVDLKPGDVKQAIEDMQKAGVVVIQGKDIR